MRLLKNSFSSGGECREGLVDSYILWYKSSHRRRQPATQSSSNDSQILLIRSRKNVLTTYPFVSFFVTVHKQFAKTVHTIRTKISTVIFYTIVWSICAISIYSYKWDWSELEGKRPMPTPLPHLRLWYNLYFCK